MRRGTGIALTAAALSVTVGVLVGAVITIGSNARAQSAAVSSGAVSSPAASQSADPSAVASSQAPPLSSEAVPISPVPSSISVAGTSASTPTVSSSLLPSSSTILSTPPTTLPVKKASNPSATRSTARPTVITIYLTTPTTPTPTLTTPTTSSPSTVSPSKTSTTAGSGGLAAGQPCSQLGLKGTVANGSNVFCQRNFGGGGLAWRAVVNGGGCLNRQMTGIGVDGRNYVCRPEGARQDRWRPAS